MSASGNGLVIRQLTASASDAEVNAVLSLSLTIFGTDSDKESPHGSLPAWRDHLQDHRALIVYAARSTAVQIPYGFFFSFPKTHPELGIETCHIWIAGVHDAFRGTGVFQILLEATRRHARSVGFKHLTVCTYPTRFERMYHILQCNGWEFIAWKEEKPHRKVLMKLDIGDSK